MTDEIEEVYGRTFRKYFFSSSYKERGMSREISLVALAIPLLLAFECGPMNI